MVWKILIILICLWVTNTFYIFLPSFEKVFLNKKWRKSEKVGYWVEVFFLIGVHVFLSDIWIYLFCNCRLMFVNRCKGLCSSDAIGRVACVPTKRSWKKVNMQLKTQVIGREMREKFKELVLEEHEECACQCLTVSPKHCLRPELFNNETCSCACDNSLYRLVSYLGQDFWQRNLIF